MGREEILGFLGSGEWVSGEEMALRQGISRAAVWKQIRGLRLRGYEIMSSTGKGYRMANKPDLLDADIIRFGLETKWLGRDLRCFQEISSTNELAKEVARNSENGTVILAMIQTEGRGRLSRPWASPPGGIWMSLILKPKMPLSQVHQINMAVSVAVSKSIQNLYGLDAGIKWPNDILINERKVCGILMEVSAQVDRLDYAVVGLGINANVDVSGFPEEWKSTSIGHQLGGVISRAELIQKILLEVEAAYERMNSTEIYEEWRRRSITLGRHVRITSMTGDLIGVAEDLLKDGALCLKTKEGRKHVLAGDCIHLRPVEEP
ncbi:MAG: biotin--[acetyl-CoA-carboxylase] ligase [Methanothrix sp.]|nr:biotin--[acetyl-CoA-carboxylase] ligase [Methanothrix sp.]